MKQFYTSKKALISILVIAAVAIGNAGSTLYLPALVTIGHTLHGTSGMMKLSLSFYLITFGLSQLFYGPLSDAFGRRINLISGLSVFVFGSVVSMLATSIDMLLAGRLIEGLGIGTANAVGYALLRDIYTGSKLTKQMSYVSVFVGITPIIAPLFGGYITQYLGWRSCFAVLAVASFALCMIKIFILPETNQHLNPIAHHPKVALRNYFFLLRKAVFTRFVLAAAFGFALLISLNAMLPFVIENRLHMSPSSYGWLTMITGAGYLAGSYLGGLYAIRTSREHTISIGFYILLLALIAGLVFAEFWLNIPVVIIPLTLTLFGVGFIIPVASSGAMAPFPKKAGSESALLGATMFCFASIFTALSSHINATSQKPMFVFLLMLAVIALIVFNLIKPNTKKRISHD